MKDCRFCEIAEGSTGREIEFENDKAVVFKTVRPLTTYHYLVIPKKHIAGFMDLEDGDTETVGMMIAAAQETIRRHKLEQGYRLFFNGGIYQEVKHLHLHILSGTRAEMDGLFERPQLHEKLKKLV